MSPWVFLLPALASASETDDAGVETGPGAAPVEASSERSGPDVSLHGDLKAFVIAVDPPDDTVLTGPASVQGIGDLRLKLGAEWGRWSAEVHHELSLLEGAAVALPGSGAGVALIAPELVDLTWELREDAVSLRGRTDRLWLRGNFGRTDITVGRQPISFGTGTMFTPLDLVAPFHPATIDQEYKPGVDAVRVDSYIGVSGRVTGVAAYGGGDDPLVAAAYGQTTVGLTDLGLFLAHVHDEPVVGVSVATGVGAVKLYGDATLTFPDDENDPFVRAVAGVFAMPTGTTTLSAELYLQTLGASDPDGYLALFSEPRFLRGEVWQLGRYYAGVAVGQEITPLLRANLAAIVNLADPSALLSPGIAWSVSDNAEVSFGVWAGLGKRPTDGDLPEIHSEFGLYPTAAFLRMATYF